MRSAECGRGQEPTAPAGWKPADRDANGLSDDLQSRLANARPGARLAVIVTFDGPGGVASSRAAVGPFQVTRRFALIHGFAATMTRSQTEALAAVESEEIVVAQASSGADVYNSACMACHTTGAAGAPVIGNVDAWTARIAQGMDVLYSHAIGGFQGASGAYMPPKGGRMDLSDNDVKAAVDYMVSQSQ